MPNEVVIPDLPMDPAPGLAYDTPGMHADRDVHARVADLSKADTRKRLAELRAQPLLAYGNQEVEIRALEAHLRALQDLQRKWDRQEARRVHWKANHHTLSIDGEVVPFEEAGATAEWSVSPVGRMIVDCLLNGTPLDDDWKAFLTECTAHPRRIVR
jgi:hypothetical protein